VLWRIWGGHLLLSYYPRPQWEDYKMRRCKVGEVQSVTDGVDFSGWGFVVYDDLNKPRLTLSYINKKDAENGRVHVEAALVNAAVDDA
jgi:hypothetical protein